MSVQHVVLDLVRRGGKTPRPDACAKEVKFLVWDLYGDVWDNYKEALVEKKMDFRERLWVTNRLTVKDLKKLRIMRNATRAQDTPEGGGSGDGGAGTGTGGEALGADEEPAE